MKYQFSNVLKTGAALDIIVNGDAVHLIFTYLFKMRDLDISIDYRLLVGYTKGHIDKGIELAMEVVLSALIGKYRLQGIELSPTEKHCLNFLYQLKTDNTFYLWRVGKNAIPQRRTRAGGDEILPFIMNSEIAFENGCYSVPFHTLDGVKFFKFPRIVNVKDNGSL